MEAVAKSKKAPAKAEAHQTNESSNRGPAWDSFSNRVKVAIWKHAQGEGKARFTTAICRSYKEDGEWHNVHFFDKTDLKDVIKVAQEALDQIDRLEEIAAI